MRLSMTSIAMHSIERELDAESLLHREGDEPEGDDDDAGTRYREVFTRERRHRRHHGDPGEHVHVLGNEREADEARSNERDIAEAEIERYGLNEARTHDDHYADDEQGARHHEWK